MAHDGAGFAYAAPELMNTLHLPETWEAVSVDPQDDLTRWAQATDSFLDRGLLLAAREQAALWVVGARAVGNVKEIAQAENALGSVFWALNQMEEAKEHLEVARENLSVSDEATLWARVLTNLSITAYRLGAVDEALALAQEAVEQARKGTSKVLLGNVLLALGNYYMDKELHASALLTWQRALQAYAETGEESAIVLALNNLSVGYMETGNLVEANSYRDQCTVLAAKLGDRYTLAQNYSELGRLRYKEGDIEAATEAGGEALRTLWEHLAIMDKSEVARVCRLFGLIAWTSGERQEGLNYLQKAIAYFAQSQAWREWAAVGKQLEELRKGPTIGSGNGSTETGTPFRLRMAERNLLRYFISLLGLLDSIECVYPELRGHSELVTNYCLLLAEQEGFSTEEIVVLSYAGRLHDIGLTSMEFEYAEPNEQSPHVRERLQAHPGLSEQMLEMFPVPDDCLSVVRHHHEHYDGTGYPDRLRRDQIPVLARLLTVADTYVSLAEAGFRRGDALAHQTALTELRNRKGYELDPHFVERFIELHRE